MSDTIRTQTQPLALPSIGRRTRLAVPEWVQVTACYLLLCAIFFWPSLLSGAAPIPMMNTYAQGDPFWSGVAPADPAQGTNRLLGDISGFYYPYLAFSVEQIRSGHLPLWNPYIFGGMPYFAANQAALLFPINLLTFWLGPQHYWVAAATVRLVLAGWGMFLLMRRLGTSRLGALAAGALFMFADFNIVWLHFAIHNVAALLPLALWLILRLAERPARRDMLALGGVVAAQLLGGHPEMSLFFLVICGLFAGWASLPRAMMHPAGLRRSAGARAWFDAARPMLVIGLAFVLGIALSAVQWLPTALLIRGSYTYEERSFAAVQQAAEGFAPVGGLRQAGWENLRHWMLLVNPQLWGTPRGPAIQNWGPQGTNYNEMTPFVGLTALALALLGAVRGKNRRAAHLFAGMLVLALLLLYPLPGLHLIGYLPLLDVAHGFRFGLAAALAAAVLAGMGIDRMQTVLATFPTQTQHTYMRRQRAAWEAPEPRRARPGREILALVLTLVALGGLSLALVAELWSGRGGLWSLGFVPTDAQRDQIAIVYSLENWRLLLPGLSGLLAASVLVLALLGRQALRAAPALLAALAVGELLTYGFGYNGFTSREAIYPRTEASAYLRADGGRVLALDDALWANSAMTQGIRVVGGMDDLKSGDQARFLKRGMAGIGLAGDRYVIQRWGQRLVELMGVTHIVATRPIEQQPGGPELTLAMTESRLRVYRTERALPRAFAATRLIPATSTNAEDMVFGAGFDPWQAAVVEGAAELPAGVRPMPITPVEVVDEHPDRVALRGRLDQAALVVLTDVYDPDWRVMIDGREAPLLRANALFRGVVVPSGDHTIVFEYRPRAVFWGGLISLGALALVVAVALRNDE